MKSRTPARNLLGSFLYILLILNSPFKIVDLVFTDSKFNDYLLLSELCTVNAEILGSAYPDLVQNLGKVKLILEFETEALRQLESEGKHFWQRLIREYPKVYKIYNCLH